MAQTKTLTLIVLIAAFSNAFGAERVDTLQDAIHQNTRLANPLTPVGVPRSWSWFRGKSGTSTAKPAPNGFSALTGWGVVYPASRKSVTNPNTLVVLSGFATFIHLLSGGWIEVQNQSNDPIDGAHFVSDFAGNAMIPWVKIALSDGAVMFDVPPRGYNDHFWPSMRGTFVPGTVDGVFVTARIKMNDPTNPFVAALGADWWRDADAPYENGFANNPGIGQSNFVQLTADWQTLYFYSVSTEQFETDPPSGIGGFSFRPNNSP